ncbi:hypothetical protein HU806_21435, partial [Pseudomonas sp. SWRI154]|nr:hypothetical protein [Pseudomonas sp. SWRI154]
TYTVTRSSGTKPPSTALTVAVQAMPAEALMLGKPRILQAADSGNGTELDIGSFGGNATVRAGIWPHIAVGQHVWMRLKGNKAYGTAHNRDIWVPPGPKVSAIWLTQGYYEVSAPSSYLQELGDGRTLTVEFKVAFGQGTEETLATVFPPRTYIIRTAFNGVAPSVKQAPGNVLNPMAAEDALTVVIPDYGIQPGDQVSVTWTGAAGTAPGGSYPTPVQALPSSREIAIPVSVIAYNLGKSVTVIYTVTRSSGAKRTSAALTLAVGTLNEGALVRGRPRILQAEQDGYGDKFVTRPPDWNGWVRVDPWPHIAAGQRAWLTYSVFGGGADHFYVMPVSAHEVTAGLLVRLPPLFLSSLSTGYYLSVRLRVAFDQSTDESNLVIFPHREYLIQRGG